MSVGGEACARRFGGPLLQSFSGAEFLVPLIAASVWCLIAPFVVGLSDPRLKMRNPDHFARLVRISRAWGIVACLVGFATAHVF